MSAKIRFVTQWELRRCNLCHHENVRPARRMELRPELVCACGSRAFTVFDLLAVERGHAPLEVGGPA